MWTLIGLTLMTISLTGCSTQEKPKPDERFNRQTVLDAKLASQRQAEAELRAARERFVKTLDDCQRQEQELQLATSEEMKALKVNEHATEQVYMMAHDMERIGKELSAACEAITEALLLEGTAARTLTTSERALIGLEEKALGGASKTAKQAADDIHALRRARLELRTAEAERQAAALSLVKKEHEAIDLVSRVGGAREALDEQLTSLRTRLESAVKSERELEKRTLALVEQVHRKLWLAATTTAADLAARIKPLIERELVPTLRLLGDSHERVRQTILARAEKRAQEVSYVGERETLLVSELANERQRATFLARTQQARTNAAEARQRLRKAELDLLEKLTQFEGVSGDIAGLGY